MIAELEELPRPAADEQAIAAALVVVNDSHRDDVAAVRSLRRQFDRALFERRVNETVPVLADLRSRFGALGATGCVTYYDPSAYG